MIADNRQLELKFGRQDAELKRVTSAIAQHVLEFVREHQGGEFRMEELTKFVRDRHMCAPDSPRRIFNELHRVGWFHYEVLNRSKSQYRIVEVAA